MPSKRATHQRAMTEPRSHSTPTRVDELASEAALGFFTRHTLAIGISFYLVSATADAWLTVIGMDGNLDLEANAILRYLMERLGVEPALVLQKLAVGVICVIVARHGKPAIKRKAKWIDHIPMFPRTRRWLASGDRSWIAYIPLYATAVAWALAAAIWAVLLAWY